MPIRNVLRLAAFALPALALPLAAQQGNPADPPPRVSAPPILPRAGWGARPALAGAATHTVRRITVHHGGVPSNAQRALTDKLVALQRFSQAPAIRPNGQPRDPWADIPYHYYLDIHGALAEAREASLAGDTNTEYDPTGHLLIMVEGDYTKEEPPPAVLASLGRFLDWASAQWRVPADSVGVHGDFARTSCPGEPIRAYVAGWKARQQAR